MHVLFLIDDFHIGGVTTFVKQYAEVLTEAGHHVMIMGRQANLPEAEKFFPHCELFIVPGYVRGGLRYRFLEMWWYWWKLFQVCATKQIDIVHFSTTWSTLYAMLVPHIWIKKRVITFYGAYHLELLSEMMYYPMGLRTKIKTFFRHFFQNITLIQAHQIITFSQFAKRQLTEIFYLVPATKIVIIPGYVTLVPIINKKKNSQFTLINFGRDEPRKGLRLLLQALGILREKGINFKAFIASPVLYLQRFYSSLVEYETQKLFLNVHMLHGLDGAEKDKLLTQADVFVMPSISLETFGLTVVETLSRGVPVIGTPVGSIPEILKKIDVRLVCKKTTPQALAQKLKWLHSLSTAEKVKLREKCYQKVHQQYSKNKIAKRILKVYSLL